MANNKQDKVLNVPTLRFPGFTEEWQKYSLGEYFTFKNGLNPDAKRIGRGIKFISVMDIINNDAITYSLIRDSVEATEDEISTYGVKYGDILFQRSSETLEDVGQANVYLDDKTAVFGGFVIRGRAIKEYNPVFMRYALTSPVNRKRIIVKGAGAQHFNIGQDGLSKVQVKLPDSKEQERISALFVLLDERIALQSKLIDRLKSLMDGIIDKVSAQTPNLCIEDCLECQNSTLQEGATEEHGKYPVYGANGICGYLDYSTILTPAILIVKDGSGVGNVSYTDGGCSVVGTLNYLIPKENFSAKFLYFILKRFNFQPYKTGMAIPHIYFKAYSKGQVFCPDYGEQLKIEAYLSLIEDRIAFEERMLSLLQEQKRYLLSTMFI